MRLGDLLTSVQGAVRFLVFWAVVVGVFYWFEALHLLLYWFVPLLVVHPVLFFWHDMAQHFNVMKSPTRDVRGLFYRLMVCPHGSGRTTTCTTFTPPSPGSTCGVRPNFSSTTRAWTSPTGSSIFRCRSLRSAAKPVAREAGMSRRGLRTSEWSRPASFNGCCRGMNSEAVPGEAESLGIPRHAWSTDGSQQTCRDPPQVPRSYFRPSARFARG